MPAAHGELLADGMKWNEMERNEVGYKLVAPFILTSFRKLSSASNVRMD